MAGGGHPSILEEFPESLSMKQDKINIHRMDHIAVYQPQNKTTAVAGFTWCDTGGFQYMYTVIMSQLMLTLS